MDNLIPVLRGYLLTRSPASILRALALAALANKRAAREARLLNEAAKKLEN